MPAGQQCVDPKPQQAGPLRSTRIASLLYPLDRFNITRVWDNADVILLSPRETPTIQHHTFATTHFCGSSSSLKSGGRGGGANHFRFHFFLVCYLHSDCNRRSMVQQTATVLGSVCWGCLAAFLCDSNGHLAPRERDLRPGRNGIRLHNYVCTRSDLRCIWTVSYTHLTLPTKA